MEFAAEAADLAAGRSPATRAGARRSTIVGFGFAGAMLRTRRRAAAA